MHQLARCGIPGDHSDFIMLVFILPGRPDASVVQIPPKNTTEFCMECENHIPSSDLSGLDSPAQFCTMSPHCWSRSQQFKTPYRLIKIGNRPHQPHLQTLQHGVKVSNLPEFSLGFRTPEPRNPTPEPKAAAAPPT